MAIFGEIGKKITQTTQSAVKGTKDLAEIAKLNSQISDEQKLQNNLYLDIGKKYYELHHDSAEDEYFASLCNSITLSFEKVEELREKIQVVKNIKKCGGCGAEIPLTTAFCGICGHDVRNQTESAALDTTPGVQCPNCNKDLDVGVAFCTDCGHKMV